MILALVATGKFTLPPGLTFGYINDGEWRFVGAERDLLDDERWIALDLCAMHFAREADHNSVEWWGKGAPDLRHVYQYLRRGDSAAAIAALHEAVCGRKASA